MSVTADPVVQQFIAEVYPRLRAECGAEDVVLYGSRVRGDGDEWSDLDVIVVSGAFGDTPFVDRPEEIYSRVDCPVEVELLCYTRQEFDERRREPGVVATACREGIWLDSETDG
ncbi:MAG: nucleotidyltransferase domain-containing protein [Armatimonadota bacterium]